jgi:hypothetical protein
MFKKINPQTTKTQIQNTQNSQMFFLCVLGSQNIKNEIPKPHHED